jgi:hypothetical protein
MNLVLRLAALCCLSVAAGAATLIDFEGHYNTIYGSPILRGGLLIGNPTGQEQHFHEITSTNYGLPNNGTGILLNDRDTQIFFRPDTGSSFGTFSLASVDVAASSGNGPATGLTITSYLGGSPVGSISLSIGGSYSTVSGAALGTFDNLIFDGTGGEGGFVLDNFSFNGGGANGIPEPGTWVLTFVGLGFLALRSRRC